LDGNDIDLWTGFFILGMCLELREESKKNNFKDKILLEEVQGCVQCAIKKDMQPKIRRKTCKRPTCKRSTIYYERHVTWKLPVCGKQLELWCWKSVQGNLTKTRLRPP